MGYFTSRNLIFFLAAAWIGAAWPLLLMMGA